MDSFWLWVFIGALVLLGVVMIRSKVRFRWIGHALVNLLISAVFLYLINVIGILGDLYLPINVTTVAVLSVLGLPGLVMMAGLKWVLF